MSALAAALAQAAPNLGDAALGGRLPAGGACFEVAVQHLARLRALVHFIRLKDDVIERQREVLSGALIAQGRTPGGPEEQLNRPAVGALSQAHALRGKGRRGHEIEVGEPSVIRTPTPGGPRQSIASSQPMRAANVRRSGPAHARSGIERR